jgi:hypothetical protein
VGIGYGLGWDTASGGYDYRIGHFPPVSFLFGGLNKGKWINVQVFKG